MNRKRKCEKLFILFVTGIVVSLACLLVSCTGDCFGCNCACGECVDGNCINGCGEASEGIMETKDYSSANCACVKTEQAGKVMLISCYSSEEGDDCSGSCYGGAFCNACGSCGCFLGDSTKSADFDMNERSEDTLGCMNGCFACKDTGEQWKDTLEEMNESVGLER